MPGDQLQSSATSTSSEKPIIITYQGEPGSYSEQASIEFFRKYHSPLSGTGSTTEPLPKFIPCPTFSDAYAALANGTATRATIPIENSLAGTIHENLDHFLRHSELTIVGEIDLPIRHCLMALPGTKLKDVTAVRSHPMALAQCKNYIQQNALTSEVVYDTAGYAKMIRKQQIPNVAAIAGKRAAEIYDLEILDEAIQDEQLNYTRFLIISNTNIDQTNYFQPDNVNMKGKSSIAFSLINSPGILCRALSVFAVSNIDLTKIESRHIHTVRKTLGGDADQDTNAKRWGYVFYVDICRHADDPALKAALNQLQQITSFYRLLGAYPSDSIASTGNFSSSSA